MNKYLLKLIIILSLLTILMGQLIDDSWMLYDDSEVGIVNIEIDSLALEWIYDNPESDSMHIAQFHFQNAHIDESVTDIGFRLRGNTSRQAAKKSFKVSFNTFVPGREFYGVDKMNLNGEHNDPSIIRSKICWDWFGKIGLKASRAAHTAVYINGDYYGLYISIEHIDDEFLSKNYFDDSGNLWKCLWPADLTFRGSEPENYHPYYDDERPYQLKTNEGEYQYDQLARLIGIINNTTDELFLDSLSKVIDVMELMKYFASNVLLGGWDDYWFLMNNYYLYHEPGIDKFHWIPYDYDNTLSIDWFGVEWADVDPYQFAIIDGGPRPLIFRIMSNIQLHNLYTHFLEFYRQNVFEPSLWLDDLLSRRDLISPWAEIDDYRRMDYEFDADGGLDDFLNSYDQSEYSNQHVKQSIIDFVNQRYNSLPNQLYYLESDPIIYELHQNPETPVAGDTIWVTASVFDNDGLTFVQLQFTDDNNEIHYYPMNFNPVSGTIKVEEADQWTGFIPPLDIGDSGTYQIIAMDGSGNLVYYPANDPAAINIPEEFISSIRLNEFMAKNDTTISDNFGEYDDWLEVFNLDTVAIILDGYYLTDKPNNLTKWNIPNENITIEPDGFTLFWCDEDQEQGNFHTNFKLSGNGEFIALVAPDGVTVIDSISFGAQEDDISTGRIIDGSGDWMIQAAPTPGYSNSDGNFLQGDLNNDEAVDILDIVLLVDWILTNYTPTPAELLAADLISDNFLDILDIVALVEFVIDNN